MDIVGEVVELEPDVEVSQAVVLCHAVVVDAGVLLRDGHGASHDVEHPQELHTDTVGHGGPGDAQPRHRRRLPPCAEPGGDVHGLVVQGHLETVVVAVPFHGLLGANEQTVVGEADTEGLDPGEVASRDRVMVAAELGVDVQIGVGEDAEVLVLPAVEVEVVAVAAGEARVAAGDAGV